MTIFRQYLIQNDLSAFNLFNYELFNKSACGSQLMSTTGIIDIRFFQGEKSRLTIMDASGRIVLEEIIQAGELNKKYDLSSEPKGLYIARIQSGQNNLTQKILLR